VRLGFFDSWVFGGKKTGIKEAANFQYFKKLKSKNRLVLGI
jgi:hypothetical protein